MGQHITVDVATGASPTTRIFNLNRSITGMAIERYPSVEAISKGRPPDVLARRLFDLGADSVTVYSSSATVTAPAEQWASLEPQVVETIEHLFGYYGDDAGWSPDNLRAIGVEPIIPPEPTA
ncbi:MAG: hypothetical protein ABWY80_04170 [Acidimicrobiia bacterium]